MEKLVLIDGHSILNRAFYGVPNLTNSEGLHTNAVYGFLNILFKVLDEEKADYLAVAFDLKAPTFRHKMFDAYKGTRKPMPEELHEQVPLMKEVLTAMGVPILTKEGYEADDILGTIAKREQKDGYEVTILSGDRDLLQLSDTHIRICLPKTSRGTTEVHNYYPEDVIREYQVTPEQFIEVKALMGDDIPANEGINRAIKIIAPKGCIVNPTEPSPIGAQIDCQQRIPDAIFGALAPVFPDTVVTAGNGACTTTILAGDGAIGTDRVFIFHEVIAGGGGASRHYDGLSGVQVNMTNTSNMPIEATEMEFTKILARKYELKKDTGGAGEMRGGLGIERELEIMQDDVLYTGLGDRHKFHPWGLAGGKEGASGAFYHVAVADGSVTRMGHKTTSRPMKKGDIIRVVTPGAGGYGDPKKRPVEKVLKDVIEQKVSIEAAKSEYGVVITTADGIHYEVDETATAALR